MKLTPEKKLAGVLAPLFALRSEHDLGIGDTASLIEFVAWAAKYGLKLVQILPINETGSDNSPYNAISSTALDPVLLRTDPEGLTDLTQEAYTQTLAEVDLKTLRAGPVDYQTVKTLKRKLLWSAFLEFKCKSTKDAPRSRSFSKFKRTHKNWLQDYVLFRALLDLNGSEQWDLWPEEQQTADAAKAWLKAQSPKIRKNLKQQQAFHAYVQWQAFAQWREVKKACDSHGVALMGDVPIGVSYYSSDVFSRRDIFDLKWSGGAPPEKVFKADPFTEKWGQNWGVPHYNWAVLKERNYDWWRQRVRTVVEVFHLFRVDHVLGFFRIYSFPWRPQQNPDFLNLSHDEAFERTGGLLPGFLPNDDNTWENRESNRIGGETLLRMILEEVGEYRLIGEDLGMVPDYVRPSLASLAIAGFKIPMWESYSDGQLIPGKNYNRLSLVTYATHDHDPLRALWDKWQETLANNPASHEAHDARNQMFKLMDFAHIAHNGSTPPYSDEIRESLLLALFESNSWLAVAMINDFFGTAERFNVPGAVAESNWSNRMEKTISQWETDGVTAGKMGVIGRMIAVSGRA